MAVPLREVEVSIDVLQNQLKPGDIIKVKSNDGREVVVNNLKEGHLLICMDSEKTMQDWDLLETSIGLACNQAIQKKNHRYTYELKVAMKCEAGQSAEALALSPIDQKSLEYKTVPMTCSCGKAAFEESPNTMTCLDCDRNVHKDCPVVFSETLCKPCGGSFNGMIWSQTREFTNTCPGDTLMTPMVDHSMYEDKMLLELAKGYKKMTATDKDFVAACTKATSNYSRENLGEAHDMFMSRVAKIAENTNKKNCFMSINEINNSMSALCTFEKKKKCDGVDGQPCRTSHKANEYNSILLPAPMEGISIGASMHAAIKDIKPVELQGGVCSGCQRRMKGTGEFPPVVMEKPLSIRDQSSPPLFLNFETPGSTVLQDAFAAPEEFLIDDFVYKKKYISINRNNSHYICHFKRGDLWITYDGASALRYHVTTPAEKIQFKTTEDISGVSSFEFVEQICYFRKNHPASSTKPQSGKSRKTSAAVN